MVQGGVKGATGVFFDEFTEVLPDAVHFTFPSISAERDLEHRDIWWFVGLTAALQSWN